MVTLNLNDLQFLRLWTHCNGKAKGRAHLTRMERLYTAFDLARVEEALEENQRIIDEYGAQMCNECRTRPRAVTSKLVHRMQATDPVRSVSIENGDLDKICEYTKEWNDEGTRNERDEVQDFRVQLRILEAIDLAKKELEAAKGSSKSDDKTASDGKQATANPAA